MHGDAMGSRLCALGGRQLLCAVGLQDLVPLLALSRPQYRNQVWSCAKGFMVRILSWVPHGGSWWDADSTVQVARPWLDSAAG